MNRAAKSSQGFTIIELLLAMTFIAVLLLAIALTVIQIGTIYSKGITLKEINQTGRSISLDLNRSVSSATLFDYSTNYIERPAGGRLCLGKYSYIWNYSSAIIGGDSGVTEFVGSRSGQEIRFLKVPDIGKVYCAQSAGNFVYPDIRPSDDALAIELLESGDRTLSIHQFEFAENPSTYDTLTRQQLFTVSFTIGTRDTEALVAPDFTTCKAPGATGSNFTYCAVQQFTLVIRAGYRIN